MTGGLAVRNEFWFKVVEMLQQNWAIIEPAPDNRVRVIFISDASTIFDEMTFKTEAEASAGLTRNGFRRLANSPELQSFLRAPEPPFHRGVHPNGPIYSSGRFWLS